MPDINEGKPWSTVDDEDLQRAIVRGETMDWIASFLCRSENEILKRAAELGLRWNGATH